METWDPVLLVHLWDRWNCKAPDRCKELLNNKYILITNQNFQIL